jgi:hypothetical protein
MRAIDPGPMMLRLHPDLRAGAYLMIIIAIITAAALITALVALSGAL